MPFVQRQYTEAVYALDRAFNAFLEATEGDADAARRMMKDFVDKHYFEVWREMSPLPDVQ